MAGQICKNLPDSNYSIKRDGLTIDFGDKNIGYYATIEECLEHYNLFV